MFMLFREKRSTAIALTFSSIFAFFNAYGKMIKNVGELEIGDWIITVVNIMVIALIVGEGYLRLREWISKNKDSMEEYHASGEWKYFVGCTIVILFLWIPVFLAYYPGLFTYDVAGQIPQKIGTYSTHHPLMHTLYLQFFYYLIGERLLHSYTAGIAVASFMQMIVFSMMLAYVHLFFYRINIHRIVRYIFIGMSAVLPFFSVLAISLTKDVLFSGFVAVFATELCYWEKMPWYFDRKFTRALYISSVAGVILFRNNGIYGVMMVVAVCGWLVFSRQKNCRQFALTLGGLLTGILLSSGLKAGLQAQDGSLNEALSLPYQQISRVYRNEGQELTNEEIEEIRNWVPNVEGYNPRCADSVKGDARGTVDMKKFISFYIKLGVKHPLSYIRAGVENNLGYFYLWDVSCAEIYGSALEGRQGYLLTDTKPGFGVEHHSLFPGLENIYEILYTTNKYQEVLLLDLLCSPALYFWGIVILIFYAVDLKCRRVGLPILFISVYMLTLLAGPCVLIRYALPYIICLPLIFVCVSA